MKKLLTALAIAAMSYLPAAAHAQVMAKAGVAAERGNLAGDSVSVNSANLGIEVGFERGPLRHLGIGASFRLGNQNGSWENGLSLYNTYTHSAFGDNYYVKGEWGADFIIASPQYNSFSFREENGRLVSQRWTYMNQRQISLGSMKGISVVPNVSLSIGRHIGYHFSAEAGIKANVFKYKITENGFDANGNATGVSNHTGRSIIPEFTLSFGYRF